MSHLDYYQFQADARGVRSLEDVRRFAAEVEQLHERLAHRWLPDDTALPVVDLACDHGSFLHWLMTRSYSNVIGVDSSPEQVALAR